MDTLIQNLRYAGRQIARNPGFAAVVVVTIALGVGATTSIFSLVDALLLRSLPVAEPDRLVGMVEVRENGQRPYTYSYARFQEYRSGAGEPVRVGAHGARQLAFHGGDEPRIVMGGFVSGDYFDLLGLTPALGRFITPTEEVSGVAEPVAVISHGLWQREFGGDPAVLGRTLRLNSRSVTVVGVAPSGFHGLERGVPADLWLPIPVMAELRPEAQLYEGDNWSWLILFGRLGPGYEAPAARAALTAVALGLEEQQAQGAAVVGVEVFRLRGIQPELASPLGLFLALLLTAAGLVLLIACVNVAGMLLARATTRRRELGVRLALGARRRRLVGQLLTETTTLFLLGGVAGVFLAAWVVRLLAVLPQRLPGELSILSLDLAMDWRVVAFGLALALATSLLFGLAPALQVSRPELVAALRDGGTGTTRRSRLRSAFVAGQIALCMVLLVAAGLLVRSLQQGLEINPGMDPRGVVVAGLDVTPHGYDQDRGLSFYRELQDRLAARPGVEAVSVAGHVPLTFTEIVYGVGIPGHEPPPGRQTFLVEANTVGAGYFRTLRIPLQGREFTRADGPDAPRVAVVNRTMAERFWPEEGALGQHIRIGGEELEIVGIAADGKYQRLTEEPRPYLYLPFEQAYQGSMMLHVRAHGGAEALLPLIRREVTALDRHIPMVATGSLERALRLTLLPHRLGATVVGTLGLLGLLLAAVGLYGVLAFLVGQRTREIGVRMALGARPGDILRIILTQAGVLVGIGLAVGTALALGVTRLLGALLLDVSATDPVTFIVVATLLAGVALLAGYAPARRASRVDPMSTLQTD